MNARTDFPPVNPIANFARSVAAVTTDLAPLLQSPAYLDGVKPMADSRYTAMDALPEHTGFIDMVWGTQVLRCYFTAVRGYRATREDPGFEDEFDVTGVFDGDKPVDFEKTYSSEFELEMHRRIGRHLGIRS